MEILKILKEKLKAAKFMSSVVAHSMTTKSQKYDRGLLAFFLYGLKLSLMDQDTSCQFDENLYTEECFHCQQRPMLTKTLPRKVRRLNLRENIKKFLHVLQIDRIKRLS